MRTAVLTVSTTVARRQKEDASGPALARMADQVGCNVVAIEVVSDDGGMIEDRLRGQFPILGVPHRAYAPARAGMTSRSKRSSPEVSVAISGK